MRSVIIALDVDPVHCTRTLSRLADDIVFMADSEAVLDELWKHEREVTAIAVGDGRGPDAGFDMLRLVLDRYWPDIVLLTVATVPERSNSMALSR